MTKIPKVAIVGRPNVGKSALFNRICKTRLSIVDEAEGVTRDRLYAQTEHFGKSFEVIDTGGLNPRGSIPFNELIRRQAEIAIEEADSLIMVVDSRAGITDLDEAVARILHLSKKPVCLAVNKIDNIKDLHLIHEFHALGIEPIIGVSAAQNWQIAELLSDALSPLPEVPLEEQASPGIRIALIGRNNVGKSSLINYLLNEERCIVSPLAGTTRDSIDAVVKKDCELYTFIDTAGIRRKKSEHEAVDKFAAIRTERAVKRADTCLLMLDAVKGLTTQEKRIAKMIEKEGKACVILFNKWDLVKGCRMEHCLKEIQEDVSFLQHCPKLMISAKTGRNVEKIFPLILQCDTYSRLRVPTPELNKFIETAIQHNHPPMIRGKRLRIYYMAQIGIQPPRFVLFVNHPNLMEESYRRYLYNRFRKAFSFTGSPIVFILKGKSKKKYLH